MNRKLWIAGLGIVAIVVGLLVTLPNIGNRELVAAPAPAEAPPHSVAPYQWLRAETIEQDLAPDDWDPYYGTRATDSARYDGLRGNEYEELNPDAFGWAAPRVPRDEPVHELLPTSDQRLELAVAPEEPLSR